MTTGRPPLVGDYELLADYQVPTASVRVIRMRAGAQAVGSHVHRRSMQIYIALAGEIAVEHDGVTAALMPYQSLSVWPGSRHSARPVGGDAVLMNISIPPLDADDQHPAP
jgi:mannose-6-phosphate isomerase-like protein (cupin superfamily)